MAKKPIKESEELIQREDKLEETETKLIVKEEKEIKEMKEVKPLSIDTIKQLSISKNVSINTIIQLLLTYNNSITKVIEVCNKANVLANSKCITVDEAIFYLDYTSKIK